VEVANQAITGFPGVLSDAITGVVLSTTTRILMTLLWR
jgi:hypothetical protein